MLCFETPTTCFGEPLKSGTIRIAQFCGVKSAGLLLILAVDTVAVVRGPYFNQAVVAIPILLIALSLIKVAANLLLYHGAYHGHAKYLRPWLYIYSVQTALLLLFGFFGGMALSFKFDFGSIFGCFGFVLILIYCTVFKYLCQVVRGLIFEIERGDVHGDDVRPSVLDDYPGEV